MSILTRNFKIHSDIESCSSFFLRHKSVQVIATFSTDKRRFEVDISDGLINSVSTYNSKNPLNIVDLVKATKDAMKNFHTSKITEKSRTWEKYKNPNKECRK